MNTDTARRFTLGSMPIRYVLLLTTFVLAGSEVRASWKYIPIKRVVETNPVVVVGKIASIKEAAEEDPKHYFLDIASLEISEVLKNDVDDPAVKRGGTILLAMPSMKGIQYPSGHAIRYKEGSEGVWILESRRKWEYYEATYPGDFQPLDQARPIVAMVATQKAEQQAALAQGVLNEIDTQRRDIEAAPRYTIEQFAADLNKTMPADVDLESLNVASVREGPAAGWVFVTPDGRVALATRHQASGAGFRNGLVAVGTAVGADMRIHDYGFIDRTGKLAIAAEYDSAYDFSEGIAAVQKGRKWGYIDTTGKVVVPLEYDSAGAFSGGTGQVRKGDTTYLLDLQGKIVYQGRWNGLYYLSESMLGVQGGYVDKSGQLVVDLASVFPGIAIRENKPFRGGYAAVCSADNLWGFVLRDGKSAVAPKFTQVGEFSEGMVAMSMEQIESDRGWGYADATGKVTIHPAFARANPFHEGLAAVQMLTWGRVSYSDEVIVRGLKWGYIRKDGSIAIKPMFDRAGDFHAGLALVYNLTGVRGLIDTTGRFVWRMEPRLRK